MNNILDIIFKRYVEIPVNASPIVTPELQNAFHSFFDTYFGDDMSLDERSGADIRLSNLIYDYQETAFEAGFYTAVKLLMGAGQ
ncbi:MAG: hypothetical protein NC205_03335 [Prevotella sp.]|nr:hypothetical protein [Prevotella sp.]MCM1473377.1 hypothetical protein [Muribaculaceae bacterium]